MNIPASLSVGFLTLALATAAPAEGDPASVTNLAAATMEQVIFQAQRFGSTPAKRVAREEARAELFRRGPAALDELMRRQDTENEGVQRLAEELVRAKLPAADGAPVLVKYCGEAWPQRVRKSAVYLLGFYDVPQYAEQIRPLLKDAFLAGAAMRTLGKWKVEAALEEIAPFVRDKDERRRILAVNALRDLSSRKAIPHLVPVLQDSSFLVRRAAATALVAGGEGVDAALLEAFPAAGEPAKREIVRILGERRTRDAVKPLRAALDHADAPLRDELAAALLKIDPARAPSWIEEAGE